MYILCIPMLYVRTNVCNSGLHFAFISENIPRDGLAFFQCTAKNHTKKFSGTFVVNTQCFAKGWNPSEKQNYSQAYDLAKWTLSYPPGFASR